MSTKTYSSKSNAKRAAKAAGIPADKIVITGTEGAYTYERREPAPVAQVIEEPTTVAAPEQTPVEDHKFTDADGTFATPRKAKKAPKTPKHETRPDGLRVGSGLAILVDTVCRPGGATNAELCAAVGWAQCLPAMRKAAAKAGVTVEVVKEKGQPARYVGTR